MNKLYINLTNGIEDIPEIEKDNYSFIRIQSTWCEQKEWDKVLQDLDYSFLMDLALGNKCIIFDRSRHKETPRAIYQGLEFIKYVLNRIWFDEDAAEIWIKNCNVIKYFRKCYSNLSNRTRHKIQYFRKFLDCDELNIEARCTGTKHDGEAEFFRKILLDVRGDNIECQ